MNRVTTHVLVVDPDFPEPRLLDQAARVLLGGGLVSFATETVYGLVRSRSIRRPSGESTRPKAGRG